MFLFGQDYLGLNTGPAERCPGREMPVAFRKATFRGELRSLPRSCGAAERGQVPAGPPTFVNNTKICYYLFMSRQIREPSDSVRSRMLSYLAQEVKLTHGASGLLLPSTEEIITATYQAGQPVSRSTAYRIWPFREALLADVVAHLWRDDPYSNEAFATTSRAHIMRIMGRAATSGKPERLVSPRTEIISAIGSALVTSPDHRLVNNLEAATQSLPENTVLHDAHNNALTAHIATLGDMYEFAHTILGDTLNNNTTYGAYARSAATLARGISLNPYGMDEATLEVQHTQFVQLANFYTEPRQG